MMPLRASPEMAPRPPLGAGGSPAGDSRGRRAASSRATWLRTGRGRLQVMGAAFAVAFVIIAFRLTALMLFSDKGQVALSPAAQGSPSIVERADIVDRNGTLLATNLVSPSLYADPRVVFDAEGAADRLVGVLPELDRAEVSEKLKSKRAFVWLKRNLTPTQLYRVNALGIPGLAFQDEQRRIYPLGELAAHAVGFVDIDNNGIAGVEQYFDETLRRRARAGDPLQLALDIRVQHALRDELKRAIGTYNAIGAGGIVMDVRSGEVLAMVSLPDFDPNHAGEASQLARFNRVSLGVYELGSVFKIFNTAMALQSGRVRLTDVYDARHPIRISRFLIRDDHPKNRWLSVPEIFVYSSNIGSAKMALDVGTERQQAFMRRLGFLGRAKIELPEVGDPLSPQPWHDINTMTVAFGHGLAVSPLQVASAASAIVNGGVLRPATLLKRQAPLAPGTRVVSERTSDVMRRLLRLVVIEGTGKQADVPGYVVGGKTGTAEKVAGRGYSRRALITSFVGIFPMTEPRYLVMVLLDEPHGTEKTYGFATAGWNAAPTTARVIARVAPLLDVEAVDEDGPEVRQALGLSGQGGRARLASF